MVTTDLPQPGGTSSRPYQRRTCSLLSWAAAPSLPCGVRCTRHRPREWSSGPVDDERYRHVLRNVGGKSARMEHFMETEPARRGVRAAQGVDDPTHAVERAADDDQHG